MINSLLYYGFHSIINQIKKLFKTWFLILIIACFVLGGVIGFTASKLDESVNNQEEVVEIIVEENTSFVKEIDSKVVFEIVGGVLITLVFMMQVLKTSEKGINFFQPADINILFTSPNTPQAVLMFRVLCQLGMYIFFAIYFMIEIPTLKSLLNLSAFQSALIVLTFVLALLTATLTSIYLSLLQTKDSKYKTIIKYGTLTLLGVFFFCFVFYWKSKGLNILDAIISFFNSKYILFIPVIGWLKGILVFVVEKKLLLMMMLMLVVVIYNTAIVFLIKNIKVDFYEEAMIKSLEIAENIVKAKEKNAIYAENKKAKKEKIITNELNFGSGSIMFLIRPLYNRYRFAKFHIITKTLVTYLFVSIISSLIVLKAELNTILIPSAAIAVFVFFRTMGNPLREDVENIYFIIAPISSWNKLLCSLFAGSINCLLDVLPSLLISGIILKAKIFEVIGCLCFIITLDFFSTSVGTFVGVSLPINAGSTVKQVLQILFIYFGLLPDFLIIAFGVIGGYNLSGIIVLTAFINMVVGFIFIALTVPLIEPKGGKKVIMGNTNVDLKKAKNTFSSVGFMTLVTYIVMIVVQLLLTKLLKDVLNVSRISGIYLYMLSLLPIYFIAMPIGYLVIKNKEKKVPKKEELSIKRFVKLIPVMCFLILVSNLIGNILSMFFSSLAGQDFINPVADILNNQNILVQIIFVALIGPFFEELFFRKIIIDHINIYGEKLAIVVSAILFGLFHGNISQGVYASILGLLLGYVYVRTGSLKYSFILHALMNLFGGILPSYFMSNINFNVLETINNINDLPLDLILLGVYYLVEIMLAVGGLIIFYSERNNLIFKKADLEIVENKCFKTAFLNSGIICFVLFMVLLIVNDYIGFIKFL